jgi:hypothetical protein
VIYAGLMAYCSAVTALQARGLTPSASIDLSGSNGVRTSI